MPSTHVSLTVADRERSVTLYFGFQLASTEDVHETRKRLLAAGVPETECSGLGHRPDAGGRSGRLPGRGLRLRVTPSELPRHRQRHAARRRDVRPRRRLEHRELLRRGGNQPASGVEERLGGRGVRIL